MTGSAKLASEVRTAIEEKYIPATQNIEIDGQPVEPPSPLEFYPDRMAYKFNVSKAVIRRNKEFSKLQRFLVVETDAGHISRQEAVSMVPPLFMDIEPHHAVMDMCAAPGSKTAQLIEALHRDEATTGQRPTGFIIANDSDYKRSHLLVHQVKRLSSPNLIVTNHDAQMYPRIKVSETETVKFDRILCDVPCSGDGTMRKNVNVWKDWRVSNGLGLHVLQLNILQRGLQLLKPGGRLVYSTCSLNPTENEAVIAEALRTNAGKVALVDVSAQLPGLKRKPGIKTWKVADKAGNFVEKGESQLPASLYPPSEDVDLGLEHCIRVYPHQQDTGGFFIAVLEKKGEPEQVKRKAEGEIEEEAAKKVKTDEGAVAAAAATEPEAETAAAVVKHEKLPRDANEEPFVFLPADHPVIQQCWDFYGFNDSFPRDVLLVRNSSGDPTRVIYYVDPSIKPILELNDKKMKFIHTGIKFLSHQRNCDTCPWRIQVESISLVAPYVDKSKRFASGSLALLRHLVTDSFPTFSLIQEQYPEFYKQIEPMQEGCIVIDIPAENGTEGDSYQFPVWKGRGSVNLMLPKEDLHEVRHRVFGIEEPKAKESFNNPPRQKKHEVAETTDAPATEGETATETEAAEESAAAEEPVVAKEPAAEDPAASEQAAPAAPASE